jgi:DNA (cytosine-5)-methyltransferase 1
MKLLSARVRINVVLAMTSCALSAAYIEQSGAVEPRNTGKKQQLGCYHCGGDHRARECPFCICKTCGGQGHAPPMCPYSPHAAAALCDMGSFGQPNVLQQSAFTYIELFAGIGGFRVALDAMGGRCVFASEIDRFARDSYAANHGGELPAGDIARIDARSVPSHDLLTAGFPCQPFSFSGARRGFGDTRGTLFREIVRLVRAHQPKALLLENVRGLENHDDGRTLATIVHELQDCGYRVTWRVLDAAALLPQQRLRLFIVALRDDLNTLYEFPRLPALGRAVVDILQPCASSAAPAALSADEETRLMLSQHQLLKVLAQPYTQRHLQARFLCLPASTAARTLQSSYGHYMVGSQFVPRSCCSVPVSPEAVAAEAWRRFSPRECARLQGFSETWRLHPQRSYNLLGNAVPPPLVALLAAPLLICCGVQPKDCSGSDGFICDNDDMSWVWGWRVASALLLDAAPVDGQRRDALLRLLSSAEAPSGRGESGDT